MKPMQLLRVRAGLETPISVILMIIIAIAIASVVWIFASSQTQTLARTAKIDIIDAKYLTGASNVATVGVKNTGSIAVTVTGVSIPGTTCSFGTVSQQLNPGSTAYFTATGCPALTPGTKLTVTVSGAAVGTGEPVQAVGQMVVM